MVSASEDCSFAITDMLTAQNIMFLKESTNDNFNVDYKPKKFHSSPISSIYVSKSLIATAGKDGKIILWGVKDSNNYAKPLVIFNQNNITFQ